MTSTEGASLLVLTPSLTKAGGVSQYFRVMLPHLHVPFCALTVGARTDDRGPLHAFFRMAADWIQLGRALSRRSLRAVHLNPSLGTRALVRDGVSLLLARAAAKRTIVFFHGWDPACERIIARHFTWLFRAVYGRADALVVLAKTFEDKLRCMGFANPIVRLSAPVEEELLAATPRNRGLNILYLARVERAKGIFEALEAYRLVKQRFPGASLTVAGDGSDLERAILYAREQNLTDVSFLGHVTGARKQQAFAEASVYLLSSHSEGLPISVLEAMAQGLPVVSTAVGGLCDFFRQGSMGYLSPSPDPATLADLIGRLLGDPEFCAVIGRFNAAYTREHFAPNRIAGQWDEIYRSLLLH